MEMSIADKLVPIPVQELEGLKDLLHQDFPRHLVGYGLILNLYEWYQKTPTVEHINVFSLNGDWSKDGLFIVTDFCDLFFYSMTENSDRLRRALRLVDWTRRWRLVCIDTRNSAETHEILSEMNVSWDFNAPFDTLFCPAETALGITCRVPEDVLVRRLTPAETEQVNSLWAYRHPGSEVSVCRLIERNYCVGAYDKQSGQLLGWCLTFISQCHNALQIEPKFMGRGLGKLIAGILAHQRAVEGKWSSAFVAPANDISQRLFAKFGFRKIGQALWISTRPKGD